MMAFFFPFFCEDPVLVSSKEDT